MTPASFWCTRMMGVAPIRSMARVRLARSEKLTSPCSPSSHTPSGCAGAKPFQVVGAAVSPGGKAQGVAALAQSILHPIRAYEHGCFSFYAALTRYGIVLESDVTRLAI